MAVLHAIDMFERVREAVVRLREVQTAIANGCDEWRPPSARARAASPDPTASAAIRNVDEVDGRLVALRAEEFELLGEVGKARVLVRAVRAGLAPKYADALKWRYIDCMSWSRIREEHDLPRTTCRDYIDIACDWIDSVGVSRILDGNYEL